VKTHKPQRSTRPGIDNVTAPPRSLFRINVDRADRFVLEPPPLRSQSEPMAEAAAVVHAEVGVAFSRQQIAASQRKTI
jgi:hypothetical protein